MGGTPRTPDHDPRACLDLLATRDAFLAWLDRPRAGPELVSYANPHTLSQLNRSAPVVTVVADGRMMARDLSRRLAQEVDDLSLSFPGFADVLFARLAAQGTPLALIGGRTEQARAAAAALSGRFPGLSIVYAGSGYADERSEEATLAALAKAAPAVVLLSMGSPRQEHFAARIAQTLDTPMALIACGAFVRHIARGAGAYPAWVAAAGLRWLWRLPREPHVAWRIMRRYIPFWLCHRVLKQPLPWAITCADQENSA